MLLATAQLLRMKKSWSAFASHHRYEKIDFLGEGQVISCLSLFFVGLLPSSSLKLNSGSFTRRAHLSLKILDLMQKRSYSICTGSFEFFKKICNGISKCD